MRSCSLRNNFRKSSESGRKSSENRQKRRYYYVYIIKRLRSLVRYRVEHSKIKFISTHGHVISSTSSSDKNNNTQYIGLATKT